MTAPAPDSGPAAPLALGTDRILAEVREGIGWIVFNHPQRHNAMSLAMWTGLGIAAEAFERDPAVRVVVLRGAGGKAFVSGADISEFDAHRADATQKRSYDAIASRGQAGLAALSKPLIAMIEGHCVGGGLAIALAADLRFATTTSRFAIPAARLGLGYDHRGLGTLAALVGPSVAKDMLFSARFLHADEALRLGLVNATVAPDELEAHVIAYARSVAANAPLTVRAAKAAVQLFERGDEARDGAAVAAMVARCFDSHDYQEGRRAFLEKRAPRFTGT